jgi:hypothetical protein
MKWTLLMAAPAHGFREEAWCSVSPYNSSGGAAAGVHTRLIAEAGQLHTDNDRRLGVFERASMEAGKCFAE